MKRVSTLIAALALIALVISLGAVFSARTAASSLSSTPTLSTISTTSSATSSAPYLYFAVSCDNCTAGDLPNIVGYVAGENATIADHSEYAGTYDLGFSSTATLFANQVYGNATQDFKVSSMIYLSEPSSLHDWYFQRMTADGSLSVTLQWSNGTQVWQGSTNSTTDYVGGP